MWSKPSYEVPCLGQSAEACLSMCHCGWCGANGTAWCLRWQNLTDCAALGGSFETSHDVPPCHYPYEWARTAALFFLVMTSLALLLLLACRDRRPSECCRDGDRYVMRLTRQSSDDSYGSMSADEES